MARLEIRFSLDTMTAEAKGHFIAPRLSELVSPDVPDISHRRTHALNKFILNFGASSVMTNLERQIAFNYIRKAGDALDEFASGATALRAYVTEMHKSVSGYFVALRHFEHCLSHTYVCVSLGNRFLNDKMYKSGDGSALARLNTLLNNVKHMDSYLAGGKYVDEPSFLAFTRHAKGELKTGDTSTIPVWLTNEGLECSQAKLSYAELAKEVLDFYEDAESMAALTPPTPKAPSP